MHIVLIVHIFCRTSSYSLICSYSFVDFAHQVGISRDRNNPVNSRTTMWISSRHGDYARWRAFSMVVTGEPVEGTSHGQKGEGSGTGG
jgi:hypothetical protein